MLCARHSGGTHDITAWEGCELKRLIESGALPKEFYIIGDEAFVTGPQFLTPWSGHGIGRAKDTFNYNLSAMRQCIERAFGIMTKRWGIFWRPLVCGFKHWPEIITVCAKLHNFCVDEGAETREVLPATLESIQPGDCCDWQSNTNHLETDPTQPWAAAFCSRRPAGETRRRITDQLHEQGAIRPPFARVNSRA